MYNRLPRDIQISQAATKVTYAVAFEPDFAMMLRKRRSPFLGDMQDDAIYIEGNMAAPGRLGARPEIGDRRKAKEGHAPQASSSTSSSEAKIDEMAY